LLKAKLIKIDDKIWRLVKAFAALNNLKLYEALAYLLAKGIKFSHSEFSKGLNIEQNDIINLIIKLLEEKKE